MSSIPYVLGAIVAVVTLNYLQIVSGFENAEVNVYPTLPSITPDSAGCPRTKSDCTIRANITMQSGILLPVLIDCSPSNRTAAETQKDFRYFAERYKNIRNVSMDGRCSNVPGFGLEHFPDANRSLEVAVFRNFRIATVGADLFDSMSVVKDIIFQNNTFESVTSEAFDMMPFLTAVSFERNCLRSIEVGTFDNLTRLVSLILDEPDLTIEEDTFFANVKCKQLSVSVKQVNENTFQHLPANVSQLHVSKMSFDKLKVQNPGNITHVYINDNKVASLTVIDNSKLKLISLSQNSLERFNMVNCSSLEMFDLSNNLLAKLPKGAFQDMKQLKYLFLQNNQLKVLSMDAFQIALPTLLKIELSNNTLRSISIQQDINPNPDLKIIINANPWDCLWIMEVFSERPDLFRVFQYEKFVSRINVNGLQCEKYPMSSTISDETQSQDTQNTHTEESDDPDEELERTLRKHILHGLLVLAGLVAVVLLIVYVWSECRNRARLPFYTSLKPPPGVQDRYDVIRDMPQEEITDYEIPLQYFDTNSNSEHVELLDTIGSLEPIGRAAETNAIYEEIIDKS